MDSSAPSQILGDMTFGSDRVSGGRRFSIRGARGSKNTSGGYRVASATEESLESSRRKIGVFTGRSTFEPFVMNASQSLFAAPKYPNPIAVPTDACAAPAPSKPEPFRPSPDRDHAVF